MNPGETTAVGGDSSAFIVTVHGIGPYDSSVGAARTLMRALDDRLAATVKVVDFDWCSIVDTGLEDNAKVKQLSRSLFEAAHVNAYEGTSAPGFYLHAAGFIYEVLFKLSLFSIPLLALLLISAVPVYVRFGSFGLARELSTAALVAIVVLWVLMGVVLASGLVFSTLLWAGGARLWAATLLRRMVLVLLQPVLPLAYRLGNAETGVVLRRLILFAAGYGVLVGGIKACSPDAAAQWSGLTLANLLIVAAGFAAILLVGLAISKVISAPVKLARDIFNYIGDSDQRTRIQNALSGKVADIPKGAQVIVIGHSLGSVIVLDSLCHSNVWSRFASVSVITAGSPIHRFFQRFFPGLYFPAKAADCVSQIQSRSGAVRWLNVFRAGLLRGDPIGQRLFARGGSGTDLPIRQRTRFLMRAHIDYWNDDNVIRLVQSSWGRMLPQSGVALAPTSAIIPERHARLMAMFHWIATTVTCWCAFTGFVFAITNSMVVVEQRRAKARAFLAAVASKGIKASARVTHSTTQWGYGELSFPVQVYEFEFTDRAGLVRRTVFRENEASRFDGGLYFNPKAFRKRLEREEDASDQATFQVDVLYLQADAKHLTLADELLKPVQSSFPIFEVLWTGIGPILVMTGLFVFGACYVCGRIAEAIVPPPAYTGNLPNR